MKLLRDQSGFIGIIAIIVVIMIIGYLIISRLTESETAEEVQTRGVELIEDAQSTIDNANEAGANRAGNLVEDANNLIDNVGQ